MTRSKKLDTILNGLLSLEVKRDNNEPINVQVTIEWLSKALELNCETWEMKSLKEELIHKELIIETGRQLCISEKGKHFITREKGFKHLDVIFKQEDIIREKTIEKFKYDKLSFWISVLAIIIAGISLVMTLIRT